jgi:hypothetical protein
LPSERNQGRHGLTHPIGNPEFGRVPSHRSAPLGLAQELRSGCSDGVRRPLGRVCDLELDRATDTAVLIPSQWNRH